MEERARGRAVHSWTGHGVSVGRLSVVVHLGWERTLEKQTKLVELQYLIYITREGEGEGEGEGERERGRGRGRGS